MMNELGIQEEMLHLLRCMEENTRESRDEIVKLRDELDYLKEVLKDWREITCRSSR